MFTFCYKGHYLHGYCAHPEVWVDGRWWCKSLHAAKCRISRGQPGTGLPEPEWHLTGQYL